jgi:glucose-1-phosphate thymidylyltransferase
VKALLLAAGYATRLHPLTRDRPKPLLEVGGKPLLSHILERVRALPDLSEIVVVGNHRFHASLCAWAEAEGAAGGPPLRVLDDGSTSDADKLGATGDIAFALERMDLGDEDLLVVAGDNLLGFDLRPLHAAFLRHRRPQLAVREIPVPDGPSPYNEVSLDETGRVTGFREKPADPRTPWVAIALYFYPPTIAGLLRRYLDQGGNPDAPGHFVAWLIGETEVRGERFEGDWHDIGSHGALAEARERFSAR